MSAPHPAITQTATTPPPGSINRAAIARREDTALTGFYASMMRQVVANRGTEDMTVSDAEVAERRGDRAWESQL